MASKKGRATANVINEMLADAQDTDIPVRDTAPPTHDIQGSRKRAKAQVEKLTCEFFKGLEALEPGISLTGKTTFNEALAEFNKVVNTRLVFYPEA